DFSYSFELNDDVRFERERECLAATSGVIAALEPSLGPYAPGSWREVYPAWSDMETRAGPPRDVGAGNLSRMRIYRRDDTQYFFAVLPVRLGVATLAYVVAINTRSRTLNGAMGYDCSISIAFKTPSAAPAEETRH